jgi:hypothetical protein
MCGWSCIELIYESGKTAKFDGFDGVDVVKFSLHIFMMNKA